MRSLVISGPPGVAGLLPPVLAHDLPQRRGDEPQRDQRWRKGRGTAHRSGVECLKIERADPGHPEDRLAHEVPGRRFWPEQPVVVGHHFAAFLLAAAAANLIGRPACSIGQEVSVSGAGCRVWPVVARMVMVSSMPRAAVAVSGVVKGGW